MKKVTFFIAVLLQFSSLNAAVYYVSPEGSGSNTGADWDNALDLSTASLANGEAGDEFWVKAGEYQVNISITNRIVYGGFDGTETELSQRNWVKNKTIIKGVPNATDPLVNIGAIDATLDGVIVQDNQNSTKNGGGIQISFKGTVRNCIIRNNSTGGANVGGGIFVSATDTYPLVENCLIINNAAPNNGGGIQVANGAALQIINSTIANNKITKETALDGSGFGCGIGLPVNSNMVAQNCIVYNNQKPDGEGMLTFSFGTNKGMNNNAISIAQNCAYDAINAGSGTQNSVVFAEKTNCIDDLSASKTAGFVSPVSFVGTVLTTDTEYAEFASVDYSLLSTSDCVDAGNNEYILLNKDLAGNERICNSLVDMGAYEYTPSQTVGLNDNRNAVSLYKENNLLIISGLNNGDNVSVYNALGKIVFSSQSNGNTVQIPLSAKGIYIVKMNNQSRKIVF